MAAAAGDRDHAQARLLNARRGRPGPPDRPPGSPAPRPQRPPGRSRHPAGSGDRGKARRDPRHHLGRSRRSGDPPHPHREARPRPLDRAPGVNCRAVARSPRPGRRRRGLNGRHGEAVIRLALETGARLGEILAITWGDLDGRGILRIRTEKRGPDRSIELQESTIRLLQDLRDPADGAGAIFASPRTGRQRSHIRRFWRAVRKGAGIPHVRFHDLRHTAASEMLRRGLLLREVQYVLGHSSPRMTERYAHFARTFKPPKSLSWSVQQSVMHEPARQAAPTH
ncbi:MAG: site-specific integrase [Thermoanaerobaculia bacterium]